MEFLISSLSSHERSEKCHESSHLEEEGVGAFVEEDVHLTVEKLVGSFVHSRNVDGDRVSISASHTKVVRVQSRVSSDTLEAHVIHEVVWITSLVLEDVDVGGDVGADIKLAGGRA